jgi:LacI family transcriptional regulator
MSQAACCFDVGVALALLAAGRTTGVLVPDDLAMIGCDNSIAGRCTQPELTTAEMHAAERAAAIADVVLRITGRGPGRERRVWPAVEMIVRTSA